jgi:hypothetical protein
MIKQTHGHEFLFLARELLSNAQKSYPEAGTRDTFFSLLWSESYNLNMWDLEVVVDG